MTVATKERTEKTKSTEVFVYVDRVPLGLVTALKTHIWELLDGPDTWGEIEADVTMRLDLTDEQINRLRHYLDEALPEHGGKVEPRQ